MEMSFWTAVVIIVAIGALTNLRLAKIRAQHGGSQPDWRDWTRLNRDGAAEGSAPALPSAREEELQREIQDLRERVKVLERIATDGRKTAQLADEIESLRDR